MIEWRAVFEPLCEHHFTVYALDFQGYGMSDTTPEGYNARDFAEQITSFIADVIGQKGGSNCGCGRKRGSGDCWRRSVPIWSSAIALDLPAARPTRPRPDSRAEALMTAELACGRRC